MLILLILLIFFFDWSFNFFKLELSNYFPRYFLVDFYQNVNCVWLSKRALWMTICLHSPNINSGVWPLHLLAKLGMCGGVRMQSHACYDQACLSFNLCAQLWTNANSGISSKTFVVNICTFMHLYTHGMVILQYALALHKLGKWRISRDLFADKVSKEQSILLFLTRK